jgi:predicted site-specific integrase-resolvase
VSEASEPTEPEELYSTVRVATILGLTTDTVRDWCVEGKVLCKKINGYWRIPRSEVIRIANDRHG